MFNRCSIVLAGLLVAQLLARQSVDSAKTRKARQRPVQAQQPAGTDYSEVDYYDSYEEYEDNRNGKAAVR